MTERPNLIEFSLPAQTEVLNFLRRIWFHPLLDEATKKHREGFPKKFGEWCEAYGIETQQVFAVLVGSSQWVCAKGSDHDFFLYGMPKIIDRIIHPSSFEAEVKEARIPSKIHAIAAVSLGSAPSTYFEVAPLLLTPDNFVAGNLNLAAELRRVVLGSEKPDWLTVKFYYDKYMRGWPRLVAGPKSYERRFQRFNRALDNRAKEVAKRTKEGVKTRYVEAFKRSLENLKLPSVEVYKEAISQTGGYLSLQI